MPNLQFAFINGVQCLISEDRTAPAEQAAAKGYSLHYHIRHADGDPCNPATIELAPVCVNFWGHAFSPADQPLLNDKLWPYQEIEDFDKAANCPECGEHSPIGTEQHDYDAIFEFGKCTGCLGACPYCKPCDCCGEDVLNGKEIVVDGELLCRSCAEGDK